MNARNSWQPTRDERLAFWRDCYALSAFRDVHDYIRRWEARDPDDIGLRRALEAAVLVSYARPFKQRPDLVRLEKTIIPAEFTLTHDEVIDLRDKVIAHRDLGGASGDWSVISDLLLCLEEGGLTIQTASPGMSDEIMISLKKLIAYLIPFMERRTEAFRMQVYPLLQEGWFKVSLDENPVEWLVAEP